VLPETDEKSAAKIAERCRNLIFKEQIAHAASPASQILTLSIGVSSITPSHQDDPLGFIEEADRRLYQAKQRGRNCIVKSS